MRPTTPDAKIKLARAEELLQYAASDDSIEKQMEIIQQACRCAGEAYRELQRWKDMQRRRK